MRYGDGKGERGGEYWVVTKKVGIRNKDEGGKEKGEKRGAGERGEEGEGRERGGG